MAVMFATRLDSLPEFTGQLYRDNGILRANIGHEFPDYDCDDPRTWPVFSKSLLNRRNGGQHTIQSVAYARDLSIHFGEQIPVPNDRVEVRVRRNGESVRLIPRFWKFPYTYTPDGLERTDDVLPAADLVRWVWAVTGKIPVALKKIESKKSYLLSITETFEDIFAVLEDDRIRTAAEMGELKDRLEVVEGELETERKKGASAAKGFETGIQSVQTHALQATLKRSQHARKLENLAHHKAHERADAAETEVRSLTDTLAERENQLRAIEELCTANNKLHMVQDDADAESRKRKASGNASGLEPARKKIAR
ncbi:hypothetical protein N0V94_001394 [Neodidymelliopsis sp. IMI 364377]|nr:hypothetical protein N0V94_001394 [Neodidymelliopsis sp. IMI 364377]